MFSVPIPTSQLV